VLEYCAKSEKQSRSGLKVLQEHSRFYCDVIAIDPGRFPEVKGEPAMAVITPFEPMTYAEMVAAE
jgi:hypothetical protein